MILAHLRLRRRVSLLAAGLVLGRERDQVLAHLELCARCRSDYEGLRAVVVAIHRDPLRSAEPPLSASVLAARVLHQLERAEAPARRPRYWLAALPVAAAALAALFLAPSVVERLRPEPRVARAPIPPAEPNTLPDAPLPNAAPTSAPLPCCSSTKPTIPIAAATCNTSINVSI